MGTPFSDYCGRIFLFFFYFFFSRTLLKTESMRELVFALFPFVITVLASPSGLKKTNLRQMDENLTWDKITWPWILDLDEACTKMPKPDRPCSGWNQEHQSFETCCGRSRLKLLRPFNYEKSFFTTRDKSIRTWEDARKDREEILQR